MARMFRRKNAAGNRTHPRGKGGKFRGKAGGGGSSKKRYSVKTRRRVATGATWAAVGIAGAAVAPAVGGIAGVGAAIAVNRRHRKKNGRG